MCKGNDNNTVCMCALAVQRMMVPKYATVMSPHGWKKVSSASGLWNSVACQSSVGVPALTVAMLGMSLHRNTLSDSIFQMSVLSNPATIKLCFLIVGFKLTYALV